MSRLFLVAGLFFVMLVANPQLAYQLGVGSIVQTWKYGSTMDVGRHLPSLTPR